eukprot:2331450-Lingulodinium_polyedra.AAC.1
MQAQPVIVDASLFALIDQGKPNSEAQAAKSIAGERKFPEDTTKMEPTEETSVAVFAVAVPSPKVCPSVPIVPLAKPLANWARAYSCADAFSFVQLIISERVATDVGFVQNGGVQPARQVFDDCPSPLQPPEH